MTLIIAEAGVNHNGDAKLARDLVSSAHKAGADIVKFQTFKAKNIVTEKATQANYQKKNLGKEESQLAMLQRLELSHELHYELVAYCNELGIEFLSTAFDDESLDFLVNDLGLKRLKLPSGEITNAPLVLKHAQTGCDLIVSTGMATMAEIESVLGVIAYGYLNPTANQATRADFETAYASESGQQILREKVTVLHCTTEYPAPMEEINLNAMDTIASTFKLKVGYSDHSRGITIPIAAVAKGASVIEKHFTLDQNLEGPDHKASLEPDDLAEMVTAIRDVEKAMGDGVKRPTVSEVNNKNIARKSLVAARSIEKGQVIKAEDIAIKRPGGGRSPYDYWQIVGEQSRHNYEAGDLLLD
ncbi:N-acetylneuraminate synthase [Idiomarina sp. M1R2S28]|uniref:N-acetylneuraminate synthase n=1 Tax=Idiomarina rhizosphaerae TaxID=2961572 RepID=A0A9X2FSQ1_9GAMM|nr:N-acetylneuraminate synthase [Idiomarina rhizosphaerae]MCP1338554.1 N-acetylneuraminate synthase [Idiomarina rhizosphaerae]